MKMRLQWIVVMAAMLALMMTACDLETPNAADLDGLWTGGKVPSKNGEMEMIIRFTPNEADSTQGEFGMWYEGKWTDEDAAGQFTQGYSASVPGTYQVIGNEVVFSYNSDKVGIKLDDDDALTHAKALQEAGEEGSIEAIAEGFKQMFGGYLGESFQGMFKSRNNGSNRHSFSVSNNELTLATGDVEKIVLKKSVDEN